MSDKIFLSQLKLDGGSISVEDLRGTLLPVLDIPSCNMTTQPEALTSLMIDENSTALSFKSEFSSTPTTLIVLNGNASDHIASLKEIRERLNHQDENQSESYIKKLNRDITAVTLVTALSIFSIFAALYLLTH
jgi:hypothetical protein